MSISVYLIVTYKCNKYKKQHEHAIRQTPTSQSPPRRTKTNKKKSVSGKKKFRLNLCHTHKKIQNLH